MSQKSWNTLVLLKVLIIGEAVGNTTITDIESTDINYNQESEYRELNLLREL